MILGLVFAVIFAILFFLWMVYNTMTTNKLRVDEAWSQIDVQLKRRTDLIPNLVESVKAYAKHEQTVFDQVNKAREKMLSATSLKDKDEANQGLAGALKSVFAIAENYPDLKASQNFKQLQEELADTEDKVAYSRQFYNQTVMDYNVSQKVFPNVLVASQLGFKPAEFFGKELSTQDRQPVKVNFN